MTKQSALRLVDVAQRAGVSIATASRSLTGSSGVSAELAAHVCEVAREMGYVANMHARTLASGSSLSVGLVVHEIGDPYFAEIASGVLKVGAERGLTVQICHSGRDPERELDQIRQLIANRVGTIIVAGSGYTDPDVQRVTKSALAAFAATGGRVSVVGRHHLGVDAVLPDNEGGGEAVARHLLDLGHRSIAIVSGSRSLTTIVDRLAGVSRALAAFGLDLEDMPIVVAPFTREGGKAATERVLDEHPGVTAILALNDDMAIGALSVLRRRGVAVPERMSVAGFDDVAVAEDLAPSLTTVRLPMSEMGEQALQLALLEPASRPRRRRTASQLVVRDSTGRPAS